MEEKRDPFDSSGAECADCDHLVDKEPHRCPECEMALCESCWEKSKKQGREGMCRDCWEYAGEAL